MMTEQEINDVRARLWVKLSMLEAYLLDAIVDEELTLADAVELVLAPTVTALADILESNGEDTQGGTSCASD